MNRACRECGKALPESEFYGNGKGGLMIRCKTCDNGRERKQSQAQIIRRRARQRAAAALVKAHQAEFDHLVEFFTEHAQTELDVLDDMERASPEEPTRLRPGRRRQTDAVVDRVNALWVEVGKCSECSHHHGHGHACMNCGAEPVRHADPLPDQRGTCVCLHPARKHDPDDGCLVTNCDCSGHPDSAERAA